MRLRGVLGLALLCHGVIAGRQGRAAAEAAPRKLQGRFLHITDMHPDEFYKAHSSTDEDGACHRGKGPAGPYGAETTDCDSPFALVHATLDWVALHLKDKVDFVVWTGDSARHDRDERLPRNLDQVLGTNTWIADKFARMFAAADGRGMAVPVVPTFGNNDILPHNILLPGPNKWLQHYLHIWRHFIPEEQRHSFEHGGWFHVEVVPDKLAVFSLNTLYFFDRNAAVDGCAKPSEPGYKQLEWLRAQLQFMRERGMKAILSGHVPPARTQSKRLWDETCWHKYSLWLHQFRDVVVAGLYGHMNIDHFLIHDKKDIDIAALSGASHGLGAPRAMEEDGLSVQSASDYLIELRDRWAKLTPPPAFSGEPGEEASEGGKRRRKGKAPKDPWGERYHLSLIGPSVVPTYFPTLRVIEYNISGLENAPVWQDRHPNRPVAEEEPSQKHLSLRHLPPPQEAEADGLSVEDVSSAKQKDKKKKRKKKKKKKDRNKQPPHHDDPKLIIPAPPSKSSPPGPAYSPQPLTLTGYTQYFANLTHINNLTLTAATTTTSSSSSSSSAKSAIPEDPAAAAADDDDDNRRWWLARLVGLLRWRRGKHAGKKPPPMPTPQPREFGFEVEYSTFDDDVYALGDLTVHSFVALAVRIGERVGAAGAAAAGAGAGGGEDWEEEGKGEGAGEEGGDAVEVQKEKKEEEEDEAEGKKGKNSGKHNETWLHFLEHAFVGTVDRDELNKFG